MGRSYKSLWFTCIVQIRLYDHFAIVDVTELQPDLAKTGFTNVTQSAVENDRVSSSESKVFLGYHRKINVDKKQISRDKLIHTE